MQNSIEPIGLVEVLSDHGKGARGVCHFVATFVVAKAHPAAYSSPHRDPAATARTALRIRIHRVIMDEPIQKSCWGVTAKAVLGFAGILLLTWLIGGGETAAVLVAG
ncbi:hypothetical protein KEU06_22385 [Pseudaminobacter sp. 19-2017]|uniref:Uncharacterized protein n=1 Tax=Pseudaminobacter soli (ex Zhang et al. 2022) TaxID=2831468 RepID=A0A942E1S5_9HYPH|nr:hypothetical protein [Pseudaminobacter soli]MBS3651367.1 hypothetical protein [Pseudaminobacter soli]